MTRWDYLLLFAILFVIALVTWLLPGCAHRVCDCDDAAADAHQAWRACLRCEQRLIAVPLCAAGPGLVCQDDPPHKMIPGFTPSLGTDLMPLDAHCIEANEHGNYIPVKCPSVEMDADLDNAVDEAVRQTDNILFSVRIPADDYGEPYTCGSCGKMYQRNRGGSLTLCTVSHSPGWCCHWGEREVVE